MNVLSNSHGKNTDHDPVPLHGDALHLYDDREIPDHDPQKIAFANFAFRIFFQNQDPELETDPESEKETESESDSEAEVEEESAAASTLSYM